MNTNRDTATDNGSGRAVVVPYETLLGEELDRRIELIRQRDNVGRGEAHKTAKAWLHSELKTDLLAGVDRALYRIWYSRSTNSGHYQEVAIEFEGTLYHWHATRRWLCTLIKEGLDPHCQSIGTFYRSDERLEAHLNK